MSLANFIFVASRLKIHQAFQLNTSVSLKSLWSKRKVYSKFFGFRYSYVLTCVEKEFKNSQEFEHTRILIQLY